MPKSTTKTATPEKVDYFQRAIEHDYNMSIEEVEDKVETNAYMGLDEHEAINRLNNNGPNIPCESGEKKQHQVLRLIANLIGMHNLPLWFGSMLCLAVYLFELYWNHTHLLETKLDNLYIGLGLLSFVFAFGVFSYYMDAKCEYYVESCRDLVPHLCTTIRDGIYHRIDQKHLVPGDVVIFNRGDMIAADVKVVTSSGVRIATEMLSTCEQYYYEQLYGTVDRTFAPGDVLFYATFISSGHGTGIVLRTKKFFLTTAQNLKQFYPNHQNHHQGKKGQGQPGQQQPNMDQKEIQANTLSDQVDNFLHYLSFISFTISFTYGVTLYCFFDFSLIYSTMYFIAHYVGIITEALLPTLQVSKAQSAKKIAYKNCYIQNVEALETLGTTSIICTNKTGVITQNRMIVAKVWIDGHEMASYDFIRNYKGVRLAEPYASFVRATSLCIFAHFSTEPTLYDNFTAAANVNYNTSNANTNFNSCAASSSNVSQSIYAQQISETTSPFKRSAIGKPTEVALLRFMEAFLGTSVEYVQKQYTTLMEVSFSPIRKCSYKIYEGVCSDDLQSSSSADPHSISTIGTATETTVTLVCVKGEPETVIGRSDKILTRTGLHSFSIEQKSQLLSFCNYWGKKNYRMIAVGQAIIDQGGNHRAWSTADQQQQWRTNILATSGTQVQLQFLGLIMLENPVRETVPEAIFKCKRGGIKVIMTTADHPQTALSIAKTVGIVLGSSPPLQSPLHRQPKRLVRRMSRMSRTSILKLDSQTQPNGGEVAVFVNDGENDDNEEEEEDNDDDDLNDEQRIMLNRPSNLYTGDQLATMSDVRLEAIIASLNELVFARITPETKCRIVQCAKQLHRRRRRQRRPEIVAVTGVGTSDLTVFSHAHVRIALGQYGTDVCKPFSDVILLNDNFASIVVGIEEGRVLFENIKKSLCYTLSSKPVELMPYLVFIIFSVPKIIGPIVVLAIDLITDNLPPIALGYELGESNVMEEKPEYFRKKLVNFETIIISLFFYGVMQFLSGLFSFVVVMSDNGFWISDLIGIRKKWHSNAINDLCDSYGQEWTYRQRTELEYSCQTVYFITIAVTRVAVLFSCRTRKDSVIKHLFNNSMINFSIFFQLFAAVFFSYYSPFQYSSGVYPIKLYWWFLGLPFFFKILFVEELRMWIIRRYPRSVLKNIVNY